MKNVQKIRAATMWQPYILINIWCLFSHSLQPLHHAEHDRHGDEADGEEHAPALPDVPSVEHDGTNEDEEVADGRGTEPQTLAEAHHVARSHLRDEGQA